ncbi:MAG: hypothetical protein R3A13_02160 [Bdellovibrionota bacterium]
MSLISIKNVVAPFSNKVHLVTITVITLTFGIYRASGGTIEISDRQQNLNSQRNSGNIFEKSKNLAEPKAYDFSKKAATNKAKSSAIELDDDSFLKSVLGTNANSVKKSKPVENESDSQEPGGLEDIEKSLGLK